MIALAIHKFVWFYEESTDRFESFVDWAMLHGHLPRRITERAVQTDGYRDRIVPAASRVWSSAELGAGAGASVRLADRSSRIWALIFWWACVTYRSNSLSSAWRRN